MEFNDHNYYKIPKNNDMEIDNNIVEGYESVFIKEEIPTLIDFCCQVDFIQRDLDTLPINYMICNQIIENGIFCAETQTKLKLKDNQKKVIKSSTIIPKGVTTIDSCGLQSITFQGITSINFNNDLISMCGVSFKIFNLLLKNLPAMKQLQLGNANRLLIFLMKIKQGLDNTALAILFGLSSQTITDICKTTIRHFASIFKIKWPDRKTVKTITPNFLKNRYLNSRAIIDCIDVHVQVPEIEEDRTQFYATYKDWHNFKFFLACAPNGAIIFKSKCYLDKKEDELLINECEFLNLLEKGDTVLTNKEFLSIKPKLKLKGINYFSPPFTKNAISDIIDIHVKQCVNRIKSFKILSTLPSDLFLQVDEIVHICCCLINLQI